MDRAGPGRISTDNRTRTDDPADNRTGTPGAIGPYLQPITADPAPARQPSTVPGRPPAGYTGVPTAAGAPKRLPATHETPPADNPNSRTARPLTQQKDGLTNSTFVTGVLSCVTAILGSVIGFAAISVSSLEAPIATYGEQQGLRDLNYLLMNSLHYSALILTSGLAAVCAILFPYFMYHFLKNVTRSGGAQRPS